MRDGREKHTYFYHEHIRRLIVAFGSLFDDMAVVRRKRNGEIIQTIYPVPIRYAPRDKFLDRNESQPEDDGPLNTKFHECYPRMTFEITSMDYSPSRALSGNHRHMERRIDSDKTAARIKAAVPYDFGVRLTIASRNAHDAHQLVEQIIPHFAPQTHVTIKDDPANGHMDIPILLTGIDWEDEYEGIVSESVRRVIFDINFIAQYHFYGQAATVDDEEVLEILGKDTARKPEIRHGTPEDGYGYFTSDATGPNG